MREGVFRFGGFMFMVSGAICLFLWIVSFMDGFQSSPFPGISAFDAAFTIGGAEILKVVLMTVGAITTSIGLIFAGLVFVRIPIVFKSAGNEEINKKLNRMQNIVMKLLQHIKKH